MRGHEETRRWGLGGLLTMLPGSARPVSGPQRAAREGGRADGGAVPTAGGAERLVGRSAPLVTGSAERLR